MKKILFALFCLSMCQLGMSQEKEYKFTPLPKAEILKEPTINVRMYFQVKVPNGMLMYLGTASWESFAGRTLTKWSPNYGMVVFLNNYKGKPLGEGDSVNVETRIIGVYEFRGRSYKVYKVMKVLTDKELNDRFKL